jgi:hypothetical protein
MQLYGSFQDLRQEDASITTYIQHAKSLFDELVVAGRPLSLEDFNLYIFRGLRDEFKDLVISLVTKKKSFSYADRHNHLFTHELSLLFPSWLQIHLCCPHHLCCPLLILPNSSTTLILVVTEVVPTTVDAPTVTGTTAMTSLIFMALIPLLLRIRSKVIGSSPDDLLLEGSGLITGLLSRMLSVSYAFSSAIQPHNVISFTAVVTNPLPILLLVRFLPLFGSWTLVRTNTLRLILRI